MKERAFAEAAEALRAGEIVGIFPEGKLTETGELNPFRPGVQQMIETTPVPVVPMALRGLWGSFFSRSYERQGDAPLARNLFADRVRRRAAGAAGAASRSTALQATVLALRGDAQMSAHDRESERIAWRR